MDLHLRDRVYLVTGGTRGLGFAAAEVLVAEGARVILSGPHETSAAEAAARLTQDDTSAGRVAWVAADHADAATPARLIAAAEDRFGRLDGALVSVGGTPPGTIATTRTKRGILPVRIATDRVRQLDAQSGDPDEVRARKSQEIPLRRYGEPAEFGRLAAFLLSPAASYMTGAMVPVDGGSIRSI
jgi:NAD(P)-dependent dehydrogenase (short-subunit alcohol dehydrogenase family)